MEILDKIVYEINRRFDALKDINSKFDFLNSSQINKTDSVNL